MNVGFDFYIENKKRVQSVLNYKRENAYKSLQSYKKNIELQNFFHFYFFVSVKFSYIN